MTKPLIGITAGEIINKDRPFAPIVYGQTHTYVDAVIRSGGIPVILPLTSSHDVLIELMEHVDGLVLAGGNDINPALYNEQPYTTTMYVSELRDSTEYCLLEEAVKKEIPVLAICRGMQLLNVFYGGNLYQHIPHDIETNIAHEVIDPANDPLHDAHNLVVKSGTKLHKILRETDLTVNSYHHQAVKEVGAGLRVTAFSPDDELIEGIETDDERFIIGVQSHPESITESVPAWHNLFEAFIAKSSETKSPSNHQNSDDT